MSEETHPLLEINQNIIIGLAIAASIIAIVLYYENKQLQNQLMAMPKKTEPCDCEKHKVVTHSANPSVIPNDVKPPEVVVD